MDISERIFPGQGVEFSKSPEEYCNKRQHYGLWRGVVEDVRDPEFRCRVRVRIAGIHSEDANLVPVASLPWAEPCFPIAGDNHGDVNVPYTVGDFVWIQFVGGEPDQPVYMGGWYGMKGSVPETPSEVVNSQYPKRRIIKTKKGHKIELSDEDSASEIKITDAKGNVIHLDTEENVLTIKWDGNVVEEISGDYTRHVEGNEEIIVQGDRAVYVYGQVRAKMSGGMRIEGNYYVVVDGWIEERINGRRITRATEEFKYADTHYTITAPNIHLNGNVHGCP